MGRPTHTITQAFPLAVTAPVPELNIHAPVAIPTAQIGINVVDPTTALEATSPPLPPVPEQPQAGLPLLGSLLGLPAIAQTPGDE